MADPIVFDTDDDGAVHIDKLNQLGVAGAEAIEAADQAKQDADRAEIAANNAADEVRQEVKDDADRAENAADSLTAAFGGISYLPPVEYGSGINIDNAVTTVEYNGEVYAPLPSEVPFVTSGTFETDKFRVIQGVIYADLSSTDPGKGAAMVGRNVIAVDSIADLLALPPGARRGDLRYLVKGYHAGTDVGGGEFYWDATSTEDDNGGTVFEVSGVATGRFVRRVDGAINLSWFGPNADWDGSTGTDDSSKINAAKDAAQSNGVKLVIPNGRYLYGSATGISLDSGAVIVGDGAKEDVEIYFSSLGDDEPAIGAVDKVGIEVSNLFINGPETVGRGGIVFAKCNDCLVYNVLVENSGQGIHFTNSDAEEGKNVRNKAERCIARNVRFMGFLVQAGDACAWDSNEAYDCRNYDGFKTSRGTKNIRISDCYAKGNARDGFDLFDGFINSVISGCIAEANTFAGFDIKGTLGGDGSWSDDYVIHSSVVSDCVAKGNGGSGFSFTSIRKLSASALVSVENAKGFRFNNVQMSSFSSLVASFNSQEGFYLNDTSRNSFTACGASNNSYDDGVIQNGTYDGWKLANDSSSISRNQFVGCYSINNPQAGRVGGQRYGLYSESSAEANDLSGFHTTGNITGHIGAGDLARFFDYNIVANQMATGERAFARSKSADFIYELSPIGAVSSNNVRFTVATASSGTRSDIVSMFQSGIPRFGSISNDEIRIMLGAQNRFVFESSAFIPSSDDARNLGSPDFRWTDIYATNDTIITSDGREKQQAIELDEAECLVAKELKALIRKFKLNKSVESKGNAARWHIGIIAQDVKEAFEKHGLNAHDYGLLCYDEWSEKPEEVNEKTGEVEVDARPAGDRYGIRYDELLAFIVAAL